MKLSFCSEETRKFYQKLYASRNCFVPKAGKCRDKDGSLSMDICKVIKRWKHHFDEHQDKGRNSGTKEVQESGRNNS